jgi:hypothetical protein
MVQLLGGQAYWVSLAKFLSYFLGNGLAEADLLFGLV